MKKLIALDIDDTLTNQTGKISLENIQAVRTCQEKGHIIALVSARPPQGVEIVAQELGGEIYRISYIGALIQSSNQEEILRLTLPFAVAKDIAKFADENRYSLTLTINDKEFHSQNKIRKSMTKSESVDSAGITIDNWGAPIIIGVHDPISAVAIFDYCLQEHANSINMPRHLNQNGIIASLLIVDSQAQKGKALLSLCQKLSVQPENVVAIGDSESDISMFQIAGQSVAVANASPIVKEAASLVAPFDSNIGVAWALNHLNLTNQQ